MRIVVDITTRAMVIVILVRTVMRRTRIHEQANNKAALQAIAVHLLKIVTELVLCLIRKLVRILIPALLIVSI